MKKQQSFFFVPLNWQIQMTSQNLSRFPNVIEPDSVIPSVSMLLVNYLMMQTSCPASYFEVLEKINVTPLGL